MPNVDAERRRRRVGWLYRGAACKSSLLGLFKLQLVLWYLIWLYLRCIDDKVPPKEEIVVW